MSRGALCAQTLNLTFCYGRNTVLEDISLEVPEHRVVAITGPVGAGKSTLLRCFNRMNDHVPGARLIHGAVLLSGKDIYRYAADPGDLRRRVSMVFQKSLPFSNSIFENVVYGLRIAESTDFERDRIEAAVEGALRGVGLWEQTSDRLANNARELSGDQQLRLGLARAIVAGPDLVLMDEPLRRHEEKTAGAFEELIRELKSRFTFVIVCNSAQQAVRISDMTACLDSGRLVETRDVDSLHSRL